MLLGWRYLLYKTKEYKTFLRNLIFLYLYYRQKKTNRIADIYCESWNTLKKSDIGSYKAYIKLKNGMEVNLYLVDVDRPGMIPQGVYFDIEYMGDLPYIRNCSFKEFYNLYKELILYIADNEEVI